MVYVEGSPSADAYMNKDNVATGTLRMRVQNLQLLSNNTQDQGSTAGYASNAGGQPRPAMKSQNEEVSKEAQVPDDLPF